MGGGASTAAPVLVSATPAQTFWFVPACRRVRAVWTRLRAASCELRALIYSAWVIANQSNSTTRVVHVIACVPYIHIIPRYSSTCRYSSHALVVVIRHTSRVNLILSYFRFMTLALSRFDILQTRTAKEQDPWTRTPPALCTCRWMPRCSPAHDPLSLSTPIQHSLRSEQHMDARSSPPPALRAASYTHTLPPRCTTRSSRVVEPP